MSQFWLALQRWGARRRSRDGVFRAFIDQPMPASGTLFSDAELVCMDIETTGLNPKTVDMLSIGWVLIRNSKVDLATAEALIVKPEGGVGDSASVHGLTDTMVRDGMRPAKAIERVLDVLAGRVLVVHHAGLDKGLLDRICREQYSERLIVPMIDTLALEHRQRTRRHHLGENGSLRLPDLRKRYNLPWYRGHNCLTDAVATAELLIAMVATREQSQKTTLADLY